MFKRATAILLSLMLLAMAFAGCTSKPAADSAGTQSTSAPAASGDGAASAEPVTIRFTTWDTASQLETYKKVIDKFMSENPDIIVQVESVSENYEQKLFTAAAAKNAPDVFLWWNYPMITEKGIVAPLDEYVGTLIDESLYYPEIFNSSKVNGVLYSVPNIPTTRAVFYNKDLFDAAGVAYPTEDWTWDDLVDKAKQLTSDGVYGFVTDARNAYSVQQFVWTNGGAFISEDGKTVEGIMNSPETAEAVQWYADLVAKHKVSPSPSSSTSMGGSSEMFKTGKVAMVETGMWPLGVLREADFEIGTSVTPSKDGKRVGVMHSSGLCVSADSQYKDQAVKFAAMFGGKSCQTEFVKLGFGIAEMPSIVEDLKLNDDPLIKPFLDMIPYCTVKPSFYTTSDWLLIDEKLATAIDKAQAGEATAQEALDAAVQEINASVLVGK